MANLAQFESALIGERVRAGMARAKVQGKRTGRPSIRAGSVCLNRFSGLIGGAPAGFRLPQSATAG
jgi:DNA invertase Pin-like site-specific DNA recombinase